MRSSLKEITHEGYHNGEGTGETVKKGLYPYPI